MAMKRTGFQSSANIAFPVRPAACPIGEAELSLVQMVMARIASDWSVELQGVCTDEAVLVLLPDGGDDAMGPSFIISREAFCFRLDQLHWDRLTELGVFSSLLDIMATLRPRLAFCSVHAVPASVTVHYSKARAG